MNQSINIHIRAILLMALMLLMPSMMWADKETWVEYADGTLTFHYDENQDSCSNQTYSLPASGEDPDWLVHKSNITEVVFSEDFKDARPERCAKWFYNLQQLTDITGLEYLNTSEVYDMSYMFYQCTSLTSLDVSHFSTENVTTMTYMFKDCEKLTALDVTSFNTQKVDNMAAMFYGCDKLTELDLSAFDTREVTNMESMFAYDKGLSHIYVCDLFVVDQVTSSDQMFVGCNGLPNYQIGYWGKYYVSDYLTYLADQPWVEYQDATKTLTFRYDNTRKAVAATAKYELPAVGVDPGWLEHDMDITKAIFNENFKNARPKNCAAWFHYMENLTEIQGIEYLCTDSVTDMSSMFYNCMRLPSIDVSHFNTEHVTSMIFMFGYCEAMTQLDLSSFNTAQVNDMSGMFRGCEILTDLNLSSFDTQNVTDMQAMFFGCKGLTSLDLTSFDTRKVACTLYMFSGCINLANIYVSSSCILEQVTTKSHEMFYRCVKLPNFNPFFTDRYYYRVYMTFIEPWVDYQADTKTLTFHNDRSQAAVTATAQYDLPAAGADPGWLEHKDDITTVVFGENFKNARPKRCAKWFNEMMGLTDIQGIQNLCTDSVTDMSSMFNGCENLAAIDLSHFCTENVTTMSKMFCACKALTTLDVTSFNTQKVEDMSYMFQYCNPLEELDLSTFDTRKVTNMDHMFYGETKLAHIYVSELFVVGQVTSSEYMFYYCLNLPYAWGTKEYAHYKESESGNLTLRRKVSVGQARYNVDGYDSPTCYTDVTFTDGSAYSAPCDFAFSSDKTASYTRTTSNHWATLCLPFAFSADDNSTARFYSVKSYTDGNIAVTALTGEIAAGTPVLAYITDGELSISTVGAAAVAEAKQLSELKGAFAQTEVKDDEYIIANDHFWNAGWLKENNGDVKNVYVAPYRASLTLTSTDAKPNSISISDDAAVTDGIVSLRQDTDLAAFLDGAELYDLQGRRLTAPKSGVMIVRKGGVSRKVVIK